jgi:hypothetical protein
MRTRELEGGDLCGVFGVMLSCEVATVLFLKETGYGN